MMPVWRVLRRLWFYDDFALFHRVILERYWWRPLVSTRYDVTRRCRPILALGSVVKSRRYEMNSEETAGRTNRDLVDSNVLRLVLISYLKIPCLKQTKHFSLKKKKTKIRFFFLSLFAHARRSPYILPVSHFRCIFI